LFVFHKIKFLEDLSIIVVFVVTVIGFLKTVGLVLQM